MSIISQAGQLAGKTVIVRVDFNVPLDKSGQITDDTRIKMAMDTITFLQRENAKVVLISHLGRPKGAPQDDLRMAPIAHRLSTLLNSPVRYSDTPLDARETKEAVSALKNGDVIVLENCRFDARETQNDSEYAKAIASLGDLFVFDAFGTAHRAHASTEGITHFLPSYFGHLMDKEVTYLSNAFSPDKVPIVAIIGGSKISTKFGVLENLLGKVDTLVVGGGMVFTLLKAQGLEIGNSLCEDEQLNTATTFLEKAKTSGTTLLLAKDVVCAPEFSATAPATTHAITAHPSDQMGLDVGPNTISEIKDAIKTAKTIIWNGPLGVFELDQFAVGTMEIAKAITETSATTIVGGGDSVAAINKANLANKISHISTGGGACLELLEGKALPSIVAIQK